MAPRIVTPANPDGLVHKTSGIETVSLVVEADISLSNVTTNNATTARHGFVPILPNDATKYYDGTGAYTVPAGTGTGTVTNTGTLTDHAVIVGNGGVDVSALSSLGSSGDVLTSAGAGADPAWAAPTGGFSSSIYLNYQDQKAQNTAGGTFTSGAWQTRVLNTEVSDVGGLGTLASNQITLTAGTYLISAIAPAVVVNAHQARLQNVTDATTLVIGQSAHASTAAGISNVSVIRGIFTVGASKALEIQHQCTTTHATDGFGVPCNFTTEVYTIVELWKLS